MYIYTIAYMSNTDTYCRVVYTLYTYMHVYICFLIRTRTPSITKTYMDNVCSDPYNVEWQFLFICI